MAASRDLRSLDWIKKQASMSQAADLTRSTAGMPRGTLRGTVVSVDDPEERGRVKVIFDDMNPEIPQVYGAGEYSKQREGQKPDKSHWIDASPAFCGKQPPGLVGKRVDISASNGQYQFAVLQDVLHDPQMLASGDLPAPNNSTMTRLPMYPSGQLPKPYKANHGCMVIELDGPMESDWLCVCLRRKGGYMWVRHVDLAHGHAGQNDDTDNEVDGPDCENAVWDYVFPTTQCSMTKQTRCGGPCPPPRPNPFGGEAIWHPPPMCVVDPPECDNPCFPPPPTCPDCPPSCQCD